MQARIFALIAAAVFVGAPALHAAAPNPAHWTAHSLPTKALAPGEKFNVTLSAQIDPGWHIYAMDEPDGGPIPTQVGIADADPLKLLTVDESEPRTIMDPSFHLMTGLFTNSADFKLRLQLPPHALPKSTVLHIVVRYQSCNDHVCLPPRTVTVPVPLAAMLP